MTTLTTLVDRAKAAAGGYQAIADAAGISLSALLRGMKGKHVLGTDALLALADAIGANPDAVLRAGGKAQTAARLARLYGSPARPLSAVDRALVGLPAARKRALLALLGTD